MSQDKKFCEFFGLVEFVESEVGSLPGLFASLRPEEPAVQPGAAAFPALEAAFPAMAASFSRRRCFERFRLFARFRSRRGMPPADAGGSDFHPNRSGQPGMYVPLLQRA
ncbi:MAG: hypothetical protein IPG58_10065 [Acidobacteria bacterium]|nr:hypothetical protein [Acidobacteriota bacterium]